MLNRSLSRFASGLLLGLSLLFFLCVSPGLRAAELGGTGAAPVSESEIDVTLFVDGSASGTGNGTAANPFRLIRDALNVAVNNHNAAGRGVRILIAPGIYRQGAIGQNAAITLPTPSTSAPIIIEGTGWQPGVHTGDVIISGSEVWTDWTDNNDGTWSRPWPYQWGLSPDRGGNPPEAMRRYELVHVDGQTYYQVLSANDSDLAHLTATEGAFWVDESAETITVRPPVGFGDLNAATVEVTNKRRLLHHWRPQSTTTPTRFVFRNLVFQHSATGQNDAAVFLQNVIDATIEDCVFRNSKNFGLMIAGINATFTVRRTTISGNGEMGAGFQGVNILAEDIQFLGNSRQADVIRYYGWGYGGIKIGEASNVTFRRVTARDNWGMGLWFDTGNVNCLVEDALILNNTSQGIWNENNNRNNIADLGDRPTLVIRRAYISENRKRSFQASVTGAGFYNTESENTIIEDSVIYNNFAQIRIANGPGRGPLSNTTLRRNILASAPDTPQLLFQNNGQIAWHQFFDTLTAETGDNDYYYPGNPPTSPAPASTIAFPARSSGTSAIALNLAQWKSAHAERGADQDSRWLTGYTGQPLVLIEPLVDTIPADQGTTDAFLLTRVAGALDQPLEISYTASGTATPDEQYFQLPGTVTIPAGSRTALIPIVPISDAAYEFAKVALSINDSAAYVSITREAAVNLLGNPDSQLVTSPSTIDLADGQPFTYFITSSQEIRALFGIPPADTFPGTAGEGWINPWTVYATAIDTTVAAAESSAAPLRHSGQYLSFTATAGGTGGKRAYIGRSYSSDEDRPIDRTQPHRILFEIRPDDISGFVQADDRLNLWDRTSPSNAAHFSSAETMTWGLTAHGITRQWLYFAPSQQSSSIYLRQGHTYRVIVDVDPPTRTWKFLLRDLDWSEGDEGTASYTSSWVPFRNHSTGPAAVGGHLHFGFHLQSLQTSRFSLDTVRIMPAGHTFVADQLPSGLVFEPEAGRIHGAVASGSGQFFVGLDTPESTRWLAVAYTVTSSGWAEWQSASFGELAGQPGTAPLDDFDGDGIPNLLEYAFGGDPLIPGTAPTPNLETLEIDGATYLTLSVTKNPDASDMSYAVEISSNLIDWNTGADHTVTVTEDETHIVVRDAHPQTATQRRFLRLRVDLANE
jgi:hypothetical protein